MVGGTAATAPLCRRTHARAMLLLDGQGLGVSGNLCERTGSPRPFWGQSSSASAASAHVNNPNYRGPDPDDTDLSRAELLETAGTAPRGCRPRVWPQRRGFHGRFEAVALLCTA